MLLALGQGDPSTIVEEDKQKAPSPLAAGKRNRNAVFICHSNALDSDSGDDDDEDDGDANGRLPRGQKVLVSVHEIPSRVSFSCVAAGAEHCIAVTSEGRVFSWGTAHSGELGHGCSSQVLPSPRVVRHFLLRKKNGEGGSIDSGESVVSLRGLDRGSGSSTTSVDGSLGGTHYRCPSEVIVVTACAAGACHSVLLSKDGGVFACGTGTAVGLGAASKVHPEFATVSIIAEGADTSALSEIGCLAAGHHHTVALVRNSNQLWVWGAGKDGRLGTGSTRDEPFPRRIQIHYSPAAAAADDDVEPGDDSQSPTTGGSGGVIVDVQAGFSHTVALTRAGRVFTWGNGRQGSLGHGNLLTKNTPQEVGFPAQLQGTGGNGHESYRYVVDRTTRPSPAGARRTTSPRAQRQRSGGRMQQSHKQPRRRRRAVRISAGAFLTMVLLEPLQGFVLVPSNAAGTDNEQQGRTEISCLRLRPPCKPCCCCDLVYFGKSISSGQDAPGAFCHTQLAMTCEPRLIQVPRGLHIEAMGCGVAHAVVAGRHCKSFFRDVMDCLVREEDGKVGDEVRNGGEGVTAASGDNSQSAASPGMILTGLYPKRKKSNSCRVRERPPTLSFVIGQFKGLLLNSTSSSTADQVPFAFSQRRAKESRTFRNRQLYQNWVRVQCWGCALLKCFCKIFN